MECREVIERLWEYLDGELAAKEAAAIGRHLDECPTCHPHCSCDRTFLLVIRRSLAAPYPAPAALAKALRLRLASHQGTR
ncbi:MAG TPA: zf-HC2 domain-containing protein [Gemmatimonadales bacterium]|nr:zf-HC2 domain-containing protein [Gemmatimonadales bacterium]